MFMSKLFVFLDLVVLIDQFDLKLRVFWVDFIQFVVEFL